MLLQFVHIYDCRGILRDFSAACDMQHRIPGEGDFNISVTCCVLGGVLTLIFETRTQLSETILFICKEHKPCSINQCDGDN